MREKDKKINEVASFFISLNNDLDDIIIKRGFTNKKLQKLLYFAQAWYLAFNQTPLFESDFQAWIHGPVNPAVYQRFKKFGFEQIDEKIDIDGLQLLSNKEKDFLIMIFESYVSFDAQYLEALSHQDIPWIHARNLYSHNMPSSNIISKDEIQKEYEKKISETKEKFLNAKRKLSQ